MPFTDAAELSAYRVVQESLTNALKHARGRRTAVRVSYDGGGVEIDVTTDGPPLAAFTAGRGLTGLRERVAQCGVLAICDGLTQGANGLSGLFERLIALTGAAGIALLARGVLRRSRSASY